MNGTACFSGNGACFIHWITHNHGIREAGAKTLHVGKSGHIQPLPPQYWHYGLRRAGFSDIAFGAWTGNLRIGGPGNDPESAAAFVLDGASGGAQPAYTVSSGAMVHQLNVWMDHFRKLPAAQRLTGQDAIDYLTRCMRLL